MKEMAAQDQSPPDRPLLTAGILGCLFVLVVVGLAIRLHFISRAMRYDESWTALHYAMQPLHVTISRYTSTNNHIFHSLLVHAAFVLFGNQPYILRLPAFLAGLALIPLSYLFGAIFHSRVTGLMTAAVVTLSAPLIDYSVNARGYTLLTFFATAGFAIAFRLMREPGWKLWFLLTLCCILGFFTMPVMAYPFTTLIIWMCLCILTGTTRNVSILSLVPFCILVGLGTLLLYTPMLQAGGLDAIGKNATLAPRTAGQLMAAMPGNLVSYFTFLSTGVPLIMQFVFAVGLATVLFFRRPNLASLRLLILAAICGPLVVLFPARNWPFSRILIYLIPIFALGACAGIALAIRYMWSRWPLPAPRPVVMAAAGLIGFFLLASGIWTDRDGYMEPEVPNADRIAAYIAENLRSGDAILASTGTDAPLEYYLNYLRVPPHHLIADEDWKFNAYLNRTKGLPNRDCWTRLFVIECRTGGQPRFDQLLQYMGPLGSVSAKIVWEGELVKVYSVSKLPEAIRGMTDGRNWVINGDFEAGNVCWWDKGTATVEETDVHTGRRSLQIGTRTGGAWQAIALRRSVKYALTAWGRVTRAGDIGWLGITLSSPDNASHKQQCEIRSTDWQKCTLEFITPFDLDQATVFAWKDDGKNFFEVDGFDVEDLQKVDAGQRQ